jgi:hypothetical protein
MSRAKKIWIAALALSGLIVVFFVIIKENRPAPSVPATPTTPLPIAPSSSVNTASDTAPKMFWGVLLGGLEDDPSLVPTFESLVGTSPDVLVTFTDLAPGDFPSGDKSIVGARGKTLLLFLEPRYRLSDIASGAQDDILKQYAAAAGTYGYPIILAPFDEFNLNESAWGYGVDGNTPQEFIEAWRHIHDIFSADKNVSFALVYNNVSIPADATNTYAAYYPGDAYVDYIGVDGFNFSTSSATAQNFSQLFDQIMPAVESFHKPIIFSSIGSLEYPGKAAWITDGLGIYIEKYPNVAGWVYFDYNDTASGENWTIDTDPAAIAAFKNVIPN